MHSAEVDNEEIERYGTNVLTILSHFLIKILNARSWHKISCARPKKVTNLHHWASSWCYEKTFKLILYEIMSSTKTLLKNYDYYFCFLFLPQEKQFSSLEFSWDDLWFWKFCGDANRQNWFNNYQENFHKWENLHWNWVSNKSKNSAKINSSITSNYLNISLHLVGHCSQITSNNLDTKWFVTESRVDVIVS